MCLILDFATETLKNSQIQKFEDNMIKKSLQQLKSLEGLKRREEGLKSLEDNTLTELKSINFDNYNTTVKSATALKLSTGSNSESTRLPITSFQFSPVKGRVFIFCLFSVTSDEMLEDSLHPKSIETANNQDLLIEACKKQAETRKILAEMQRMNSKYDISIR